MSTSPSYVNLAHLLATPGASEYEQFWQFACEMRVSVPAVVVSFNATKQTVVVQPAIQENMFQNLVPTPVSLPQLADVPIVIPRAGGFSITFPIEAGDECLVVFADMCINSWWASGGTSNTQEERRRHDLSDGIAIFGPWSQPRVLSDYSTEEMQIRSDDGNVIIGVSGTDVAITIGGISLTLDGSDIVINGNLVVNGNITSPSGTITAGSIGLTTHEHTNVTNGPDITGPPA